MFLIEPDNDGIEPIIIVIEVRTVLFAKSQWAINGYKNYVKNICQR